MYTYSIYADGSLIVNKDSKHIVIASDSIPLDKEVVEALFEAKYPSPPEPEYEPTEFEADAYLTKTGSRGAGPY